MKTSMNRNIMRILDYGFNTKPNLLLFISPEKDCPSLIRDEDRINPAYRGKWLKGFMYFYFNGIMSIDAIQQNPVHFHHLYGDPCALVRSWVDRSIKQLYNLYEN